MSVVFSNCADCERIKAEGERGQCTCDAFPDGIPASFMFRKEQDKNDICGNGLKFVPAK